MSKPTVKAELTELADDLTMLASWIRENAGGRATHPPHPWHIDDWVTRYRAAYERTDKP